MILSKAIANLKEQWLAQDVLSKCLIIISLLLVLFAYLPTLQFDYVTQDQWRAFRYSTLEQTPFDREISCLEMIPWFYVLTGRPFVWMTECVEHTFVATISDFIYLRPIVLSIVLLSAIFLGSVIAPILGGVTMGILAATAFLMAPGYSFMYLQSMPAAMVLVSAILAVASFGILRERLIPGYSLFQFKRTHLLLPLILFVLSCMIYSPWAFLVIPLAWLSFCFESNRPLPERAKQLILILVFYFCAAVIYYAYVKLVVFLLLLGATHDPNLGDHAVIMQVSPEIVWKRIQVVFKYIYERPPLNFNTPNGVTLLLVGLSAANCAWNVYEKAKKNIVCALLVGCTVFVVTCAMLLASISPWLFSQVNYIGAWYFLPCYLYNCVAFVGIVASIARNMGPNMVKLAPMITLIVFVAPVCAMQNKLSFLEVSVSATELQFMRSRLDEWLDKKGYMNNRYLLVVRPIVDRPSIIETWLDGSKGVGDNAILSSSQNPASIPWMINALLRERHDHPLGKSINMVDCASDQDCISSTLQDKRKIALGIYEENKPIRSTEPPFIINISTLTSKPVVPTIELIGGPDSTPSTPHASR